MAPGRVRKIYPTGNSVCVAETVSVIRACNGPSVGGIVLERVVRFRPSVGKRQVSTMTSSGSQELVWVRVGTIQHWPSMVARGATGVCWHSASVCPSDKMAD